MVKYSDSKFIARVNYGTINRNTDQFCTKYFLKGNPTLFLKAWCLSSEMDIPRTRRRELRFLSFVIGAVVGEMTFGRCKNSKRFTYFLPGFSSLKKNVWVPQFENGSIKKFRNWGVFCIPYEKRSTQKFSFQSIQCLCQRNRMWTQKNCFWDGTNLGRWVYVGLLWS